MSNDVDWEPRVYLGYQDMRARPFYELLARVDMPSPRRVADLGCGPGNLTSALMRRWPSAAIEAVDSSPEMVRDARSRGVDARIGDVGGWWPQADTDVVVCNAVLHWLGDHRQLLRRWVAELPSGAWVAMQVPGNFDAPSHALFRELARTERWAGLLGHVELLDASAVDEPHAYGDLFIDAGCEADVWETTYVQRLSGADPVLEWISGSALGPIRSALDSEDWTRFRAELAPLLRTAYPQRADGTTWFPFRRVFAVARVR